MIDLGATTNNSNGLLGSNQCAKKVVSDSLGLVGFVIGLVIFVLASAVFGGNSNYRRIVIKKGLG